MLSRFSWFRDFHWTLAAVVLIAFCCPTAMMEIANSVGTLGYIPSVVAMVVILASKAAATSLYCSVVNSVFKCKGEDEVTITYADVGRAGLGKFGFYYGLVVQLVNFQVFLPVAVLEAAQQLGFLLNISCIIWPLLICFAILLALTQVRSLKSTTLVSIFSFLGVTVAILLTIVECLRYDNPAGNDSTELVARFDYVDTSVATATFTWGYVPVFLVAELMGSMRDPTTIHKSVASATVITGVLYFIAGVVPAALWGTRVPGPLNSSFPRDPVSLALSFIMFAMTIVAALLDALVLSVNIQKRVLPHLHGWSLLTCVQWLGISLAPVGLALAMALFVPTLYELLDFVTALTVPTGNILYAVAVFMGYRLWGARVQDLPADALLSASASDCEADDDNLDAIMIDSTPLVAPAPPARRPARRTLQRKPRGISPPLVALCVFLVAVAAAELVACWYAAVGLSVRDISKINLLCGFIKA